MSGIFLFARPFPGTIPHLLLSLFPKPGNPMNNHSVTIKDIARILGISKSTVSRALSEQHTDVNAETREKVVALANKLNYQPNTIALNLKQQRTKTIGVMIPETVNTFFSSAV